MRTIFTFAFLLLLVNGLMAQVFENKDLAITQLEKDMWVIETTDMTTMYLIEGTEKALLIDTGTKCEDLEKVLRQITQKPLYVVLTHLHGDHAGNINYFGEIYLHPADTLLMSHLQKPYEGKITFVDEGDVFDLGGKQIVVSHMPGHTPGSIVLLDWQAGNCYTGDAFGSGQVWCQLWPFSPMASYAASCSKMLNIMDQGISRIYCGHYPYVKTTFDKSYVKDMLELAKLIDLGTPPVPQPHPAIIPGIGAKNPMMSTLGQATIVYDPSHINSNQITQ
ncbi:MAG: MBL fold metallo-hydrolase [Prolixibacteraceae bacterium]|nr:MBL fold metallo-hydrolase [Prolixibacteraceae bacterium]